jgi:hypothetical protein
MRTRIALSMSLLAVSLSMLACASGMPSTPTLPPPTPTSVLLTPKAGKWKATAEFGTFVFVVNSAGSAIESVDFNFTSLKCDGMIHSGGIGVTYSGGQKIETGKLRLDTNLSSDPFSSNREILVIAGNFSSNGETASGAWTDILGSAVCASGTWTASPDTNAP